MREVYLDNRLLHRAAGAAAMQEVLTDNWQSFAAPPRLKGNRRKRSPAGAAQACGVKEQESFIPVGSQ